MATRSKRTGAAAAACARLAVPLLAAAAFVAGLAAAEAQARIPSAVCIGGAERCGMAAEDGIQPVHSKHRHHGHGPHGHGPHHHHHHPPPHHGRHGHHHGGHRHVVIDCASQDYRRTRCPLPTFGVVVLLQQYSSGRGACIPGQSWGWDRRGIWVSQGCRGRFLLRPD